MKLDRIISGLKTDGALGKGVFKRFHHGILRYQVFTNTLMVDEMIC